MKIKIGGIEPNDWKRGSVAMFRSSTPTNIGSIDYAGFLTFQTYGSTNVVIAPSLYLEPGCWKPCFGGQLAFLEEHYAKYCSDPIVIFHIGQETEAQVSMDKFLRKMSGLVAFI